MQNKRNHLGIFQDAHPGDDVGYRRRVGERRERSLGESVRGILPADDRNFFHRLPRIVPPPAPSQLPENYEGTASRQIKRRKGKRGQGPFTRSAEKKYMRL